MRLLYVPFLILVLGCSRAVIGPQNPTFGLFDPEGAPPEASLYVPSPPQAHEVSNGGGVLECGGEFEFFDLWHAKHQRGFKLLPKGLQAHHYFDIVLRRLRSAGHFDMAKYIGGGRSLLKALSSANKSAFNLRSSSFEKVPSYIKRVSLPPSCKPKGLGGFYDDFNVLRVVFPIYQKLSVMEQVAFVAHEKLLRYLRYLDSLHASFEGIGMVACLFRDVACPELDPLDGIVGGETIKCSLHRAAQGEGLVRLDPVYFAVYEPRDDTLRFQLTEIRGRKPPSKSYFDVAGNIEDGRPVLKMLGGLVERKKLISHPNPRQNISRPFVVDVKKYRMEALINGYTLNCEPWN